MIRIDEGTVPFNKGISQSDPVNQTVLTGHPSVTVTES